MLKYIKSVLKKFIPPPTDVFNREIDRLIKHSEKQTKITADLVNAVEQLKKDNKECKSKLMKLENDIRLALIPFSVLNLDTNTIKTQNKQQLEMLAGLIQRLDEDNKNQITQSSQPVEPDK